LKKVILACISGLFYAVAFPLPEIWPLIGLFAVPMFIAARRCTMKEVFGLGLLSGLIAWAGNIYWVAYIMDIYGFIPIPLCALIFLLLIAYMSLYFAIFFVCSKILIKSAFSIITIPGIWVFLEIIKSYAFTGFPWSLAGYALYPLTPVIQNAEWGGIYILSAIALMFNVAVFKAYTRKFAPAAVAAVLIVLCISWGAWRLNSLDLTGQELKVGVCQANIPQDQKWRRDMVIPTIDIYSSLSRKAKSQGAQIIVWPETACNFFLFQEWSPTSRIIDLSKEIGLPMVIGSPAFENDRYFNRLWLLDKGLIMGSYDKTHLVPFGEYLPMPWLFSFMGKLTQEVSDFSNAKKLEPIEDIGTIICFENVFPELSRQLVNKGASWLFTASNDAWFLDFSTSEQHLKIGAIRAIENRRYLVMSVNHGISAVIDPFGRIVKSIGLMKEDVFVYPIKKLQYKTVFDKTGSLFAWLIAVFGIVFLLIELYRNSKATKE
jgi:apolipoprotein N-acyltransferase